MEKRSAGDFWGLEKRLAERTACGISPVSQGEGVVNGGGGGRGPLPSTRVGQAAGNNLVLMLVLHPCAT